MKVHRKLGKGFQEVIYQRALAIELHQLKVEFSREVAVPIYYNQQQIGERRVDFLIETHLPVEIKAVSRLENTHLAQALNYLEAFDLKVGLLINFGSKSLEFKRLIKP